MTARVVDVILRRSPIIKGGLEIEVEVTAAANEKNISVLKRNKNVFASTKFWTTGGTLQ